MDELLKIWYVSSQRLCNFRCNYCVSVGDYAKSNSIDWLNDHDRADFQRIVHWIGSLPQPVGVRLATLGEPFVSRTFLAQAAWLTRQHQVRFVELLTNGSMLKSRLPEFAGDANLEKLSLWITYHHAEIALERFIENARLAQEEYDCFVVVNTLLFSDNGQHVTRLREAAERANLRFNLDVGYEPHTPADVRARSSHIPLTQKSDGLGAAVTFGSRRDVLEVNITAMDHPFGQSCAAGHRYIYIGIDGDVYRCSRYYVLKKERLGNVLDPTFELSLRADSWAPCTATCGCCNKEDFLNLRLLSEHHHNPAPSLGWVGS